VGVCMFHVFACVWQELLESIWEGDEIITSLLFKISVPVNFSIAKHYCTTAAFSTDYHNYMPL